MLDGVPFGSSRGVVGDGEGKAVGIGQLGLELSFPSAATIAVTAAGIGQNKTRPSKTRAWKIGGDSLKRIFLAWCG